MNAENLALAAQMSAACVQEIPGSSLMLFGVLREQSIDTETTKLVFRLAEGPNTNKSLVCLFNEATRTAEVEFMAGMFIPTSNKFHCSLMDGSIQIKKLD